MTTEAHDITAEAGLVREAFRRRANHAVDYLARSASLDTLARALEAPTDFGAVASVLGHAGMPQSAVTLDPLADAVARAADIKARLAQDAGGLLSAASFGEAVGGISRQAVDKRRRANQALAVRVAGDWRYPAAQIDAEGQILAALPSVLRAGAASGITGWAMLDFLLAPGETLAGSTPLDHLRVTGGGAPDILRLLDAARTDGFG